MFSDLDSKSSSSTGGGGRNPMYSNKTRMLHVLCPFIHSNFSFIFVWKLVYCQSQNLISLRLDRIIINLSKGGNKPRPPSCSWSPTSGNHRQTFGANFWYPSAAWWLPCTRWLTGNWLPISVQFVPPVHNHRKWIFFCRDFIKGASFH